MNNSTFAPLRVSDFTANALNFHGLGVYGECAVVDITANNETHIDVTMTDDGLLTGGILMVKNGHFEDKISLQVVHPVAGVLNEFVTDYRVCEDSQRQFELNNPYPAKIPTGLILRIKYVPCAIAGIRDIALNYMLHKVLV